MESLIVIKYTCRTACALKQNMSWSLVYFSIPGLLCKPAERKLFQSATRTYQQQEYCQALQNDSFRAAQLTSYAKRSAKSLIKTLNCMTLTRAVFINFKTSLAKVLKTRRYGASWRWYRYACPRGAI